MTTITKAQFNVYEDIRREGSTNMLDVRNVHYISIAHGCEISVDTVREIIRNYETYEKKYR